MIQVSSDYCDPEDLNMPAPENGGGGGGVPRASLICRPNSHPFQDRMLGLDQPVKVGRSVARARPQNTNAIFDCKVLSRNHALLWYENGKFYLQDTKSSNGTFVNNQRLSKGSEESPAREVCSGDILQFGVDVMENSRKVTHGCIIATLRLFLPDGKEAKASPSIVNTTQGSSIPAQDMYQLHQYIQESLAREQLLEAKLLGLQRLVQETEAASQLGWKALMDEDRLLTRVEILESQLTTYGRCMSEDKLREETKRLMEEKEMYQNSAKDTLKKIVDDKLEAVSKLKGVELSLTNLEAEYTSLRQLYDKSLDENKKLSEKLTTLSEDLSKKNKEELVSDMNTINEMKSELSDSIIKKGDIYITADCESFSENGNDSSIDIIDVTETNGKYCEEESDLDKTDQDDLLTSSTDSLEDDFKEDSKDLVGNRFNIDKVLSQDTTISDISDPGKLIEETTRLRNLVEEINRSKVKTDYELVNLRINLEEAKNENSTVLQELENTRNKLSDAEKLILSQDKLVKDLEDKIQENSFSHQRSTSLQSATDSESSIDTSAISEQKTKQISDSLLEEDVAKLSHECKSLQKLVQDLEETNANLRSDCSKKEELLLASHQTINEMKDDRTIALSTDPGSACPEVSRPRTSDQDTSQGSSQESSVKISHLESSLKEAQVKIDGLLEVKEKLVSIQAEKDRLEGDVSRLEEELSIISVASRTLTACTVIPIIVLLIAIVMAFLPFISSIFGTRDF